MIGSFNPYTSGYSPSQPNISADTVSKLMTGGIDKGIQSLVGGIQQSGEIDRSSKVNQLLASGGLQGLSEEQQRQKLAQMTGGQSINPLVGANVAEALANQQANEMAQAKATAALGLEDRKSANDMNKAIFEAKEKMGLEELKSNLGLQSDVQLQNLKFGHESAITKLKSSLDNQVDKDGKIKGKWGVLGNGVLYNDKTGETKTPEEYAKAVKTKDIVDSLPKDASNYFKGLTKNQQENFKEAYLSGNIGWKPLTVDEKTKAKSGGFFYDLDNPTGLGITISNKRKEK